MTAPTGVLFPTAREGDMMHLAREIHAKYRQNYNPKADRDPEEWLERAVRKFYAWVAEWDDARVVQDRRNPYSRAASLACIISDKAPPMTLGGRRPALSGIALEAGERMLVHEGANPIDPLPGLSPPRQTVKLYLELWNPQAHALTMLYYACRYSF